MSRSILAEDKVTPEAQAIIQGFHQNTVKEVSETVSSHKVVVIGMSGNPYVSKVRKLLKEAGIDHKYLEYGSYFSKWRERLAIKLWSGWPTYPQVFIDGKLVGGYSDTKKFLEDGKFSS